MRWFAWGFGLMWLYPLLEIVLVIWVVSLIVRAIRFRHYDPWYRRWDTPPHGGKDADSAIEILKRRYANGEISKEEYERMKKDILG